MQEDQTKPISKAANDTQRGKYRYQFFQTPKIVEVDVLAKNLTPDRFHMDIEERKLHVIVKSPEGEQEYELIVDLYDAVSVLFSRAILSRAVAWHGPCFSPDL